MKILAIAEFDPCGVLASHRKALRALGVDYRLWVRDIHRHDVEVDWIGIEQSDAAYAFALEADVIQYHPAIAQPWSFQHLHFVEEAFPFEVFPRAKRIAFFHGSKNAWANAEAYAERYRQRGMRIWASTTDYCVRVGATYAPPAFDFTDAVTRSLRADGDPLIVSHTPTDPGNCQSEEFLVICRWMGINCLYGAGDLPHAQALEFKQRSHVCYDHLRGAFSVNTLEACALGVVPLVAVSLASRRLLHEEGFGAELPFPEVMTMDDVKSWLYALDDNEAKTRDYQGAVRRWIDDCWRPERVGEMLLRKYEEVVRK